MRTGNTRRIIIIGNTDNASGTMSAEEAERYSNSAAATTAPIRINLTKIDTDVILPVRQKEKRGKYWESPKYKFTGKR